MFDFNRTAAEASFRNAVRAFADEAISPIALEQDQLGDSPLAVYAAFIERGLSAPLFPSEDDGERGSYATMACIAAEELGYGCAAIASLIMLPVFFNRLVLTHLAEPMRSEFRSRIHGRPVVTSFAASEREAGSDMLALETSAERVDGEYVLNGRKEYSSNARHASYVIVVARTAPPGSRSDALSWFLVPTDLSGVAIGKRWQTLGLRSMDLSPVELRGVRIPEHYRLGNEGRGMSLMTESLAQSRTGIAAIAVGIARRARDEVLAYGAKRTLYGGKLHKLQDYRFRIADMEKDIAAARALIQLSAIKYDQGLKHNKEASIAKLYAGEMVMRVTEAASVMLGSRGYTGQSVIEKLFRDARHTAIVEGTDPVHKEVIFASILRRGGY